MGVKQPITTDAIVSAARRLGASLAGVVSSDVMAESPGMHRIQRGFRWRRKPRSVVVLALAHPESRPSMDWWGGKFGTPGNWQLITIGDRLAAWLKQRHGIPARNLPYHRESGGIFLKDAAVLAGLGVIGRNNLLITPEYGPRVRLRALRLDVDLDAGGPSSFAPCDTCDGPCVQSCPQDAFGTGRYRRSRCREQLRDDVIRRSGAPGLSGSRVAYRTRFCRRCEMACPVGKKRS